MSNFLHIFDSDWKASVNQKIKAASGLPPDPNTVSNDALEKAFMDQAMVVVSNKCQILMRDPYRIGFEIIKKNDDNTKIAGIFISRIATTLLYIPVFFINSTVKGADLLYQQNVKRFRPNTDAWVNRIRETEPNPEGTYVSKEDRHKSNRGFNMSALTDTAGQGVFHKYAGLSSSVIPEEDLIQMAPYVNAITDGIKDMWADANDIKKLAAAPNYKVGDMLERFFVEDGGMDALVKFASYINESDEFAVAAGLALPVEKWAESDFVNKVRESSASRIKSAGVTEVARPELEIFTSLCKEMPPHLGEDMIKRGFAFKDERDKDQLNLVMRPASEELTTIKNPGVYQILSSDGSYHKVLIARDAGSVKYRESSPEGVLVSGSKTCWHDSDIETNFTGVSLTSGKCLRLPRTKLSLVGCECGAIEDHPTAVSDTPSVGKMYRIYNPRDASLSEAFLLINKVEHKGISNLTVATFSEDYQKTVTINPHIQNGDLPGVYSGDVKFVEVKRKHNKQQRDTVEPEYDSDIILDGTAVDSWLRGNFKAQGVSLEKLAFTKSDDKFQVIHLDHSESSRSMPLEDFLKYAAVHLRLPGEQVTTLVDVLATSPRVELILDTTKTAARSGLTFNGDMEFNTGSTNSLGMIERDAVERKFIPLTYDKPAEGPTPRFGDALDPARGYGANQPVIPRVEGRLQLPKSEHLQHATVISASPNTIAQLAKTHQVENIHDLGTVGSLLATYDSSAQISKWMGDFEVALDRLGRVLFLFYWKPADYEALYGSDDMSNLESELLANFRSFGDLVIGLQRRHKDVHIGNSGSSARL